MNRTAPWWRHHAPVLCLCLALCAAQANDKQDESLRFKEQRAAIEAEFKRGEKECAQRFEVTSCVNSLEQQRRTALGEVRQQEIALDEARRRAEAQANQQRLKDKQAKAAARAQDAAASTALPSGIAPTQPKPAQKSAKPIDDAEAAQARQARTAAAAQAASTAAKKSAERAQQRAEAAKEATEEASAAAKRAAAREQRLAEAAERRERVEQRNARRAESGKSTAPLPDPAAASAPTR